MGAVSYICRICPLLIFRVLIKRFVLYVHELGLRILTGTLENYVILDLVSVMI